MPSATTRVLFTLLLVVWPATRVTTQTPAPQSAPRDWEGRRVVSAAWIDAAVARQSRIDDSDYGLGIWHRWYRVQTPAGERRVDTIMLSGNGGQKVYLVPSLDLIVVFTGGAFNVESPVNTMMARVLLPALMGTGSSSQLPPNGRR
jgi:CubicO group peptidase (beta-lactamase class C family)